MNTEEKELTINLTINYRFNFELAKIKLILKQITDLEGIKKLEINSK